MAIFDLIPEKYIFAIESGNFKVNKLKSNSLFHKFIKNVDIFAKQFLKLRN